MENAGGRSSIERKNGNVVRSFRVCLTFYSGPEQSTYSVRSPETALCLRDGTHPGRMVRGRSLGEEGTSRIGRMEGESGEGFPYRTEEEKCCPRLSEFS